MKAKYIILLFLSAFSTHLKAQHLEFSHYTVNDGLSQSVTNCILQDKQGFLWFGTQHGLNKFDGYSFTIYETSQKKSEGLRDAWVLSLAQSKDSSIWIGTKRGLNVLDNKTGKLLYIDLKCSKLKINEAIYGLYATSSGDMLVNTPPYFHVVNAKTFKIQTFYTKQPKDDAINDQNIPIVEGKKGEYWIASTQGLSCFNFKTGKIVNYTTKEGLLSNNITALWVDSKKNIWIGTQNGFNKLWASNKKVDSYLEGIFIRSITQNKQGIFYVGTNGNGLFKFKESGEFLNFKHTNQAWSMSHDVVLALCIDYSDNLWLGTLQAIDKLDLKPKKFRLYRKSEETNSVDLVDNLIASVYKESEEKIWIGTWGKGLNCYNRTTNKVLHYSTNLAGKNRITNDFVHVIFPYSENELWIGTRNGIEILDKQKGKFVHFNQFYTHKNLPNMQNMRINRIVRDSNKNLWIASHQGVFVLDLEKNTFIQYSENTKNKIANNQVYNIIEDSEGLIWVATAKGLNKIEPQTQKIETFTHDPENENSLCDNYVVALCEDSEKNIWIGTQNGINKYNKKENRFYFFEQESGITSKNIYEIILDKASNLWIASGNGLMVYNHKTKKFKAFEFSDGLQSPEFNLNAKFYAPNGELFLGGINGLNSFFPDSIYKNKFKPKLVFKELEVKTESNTRTINITNHSEIVLDWKDIEFTIEFAALEYTNPAKNKYAYQMKGISDNWLGLENRHFVPFSKLQAGEYVFSVRGTNNDGVWSDEAISVKIKILPPWWKSNLAYISYFIFSILAIYLLIIGREKQLKHERDVLEMKVAERTEEINAQKEEIELKNSNITASINYASRIQRAVLPQYEHFCKHVPNNILFFRPRDIVSGDFFWYSQVEAEIENGERAKLDIIIAADSTGHGVPGAFVTVIANNILDDIVNKQKIYKPHEILYKLDEAITKIFKQEQDSLSVNDGMDICIISLHKEQNKLMFAGAKNPLCFIRNGEAEIIKGSRSAIGGYFGKRKVFESYEIDIQQGDAFYIYSDGFQDQFGGEYKNKFLARNFRNLLQKIHAENPKNQVEILQTTFDEWKGKNSQTDDIIILGLFF